MAGGGDQGHFQGMNGLRACAATSIVVYHCWRYSAPDGQPVDLGPLNSVLEHLPVGVTLFFSLSGFLLYRPFAAALIGRKAPPSTPSYLRKRALRILPAYWFVLVLSSALLATTLVRTGPFGIRTGSLGPELLGRNILLVQSYDPGSVLSGLGPAWSLSVEAIFYVTLPLLVLVTMRLRGTRVSRHPRVAALVPPAVLLAVGLSGKLVATFLVRGQGPGTGWIGDWHSVIERSFWANADLFAFGMVVAVLSVDVDDGVLSLPRLWRPTATMLALVVGLGAVVLSEAGFFNRYHYDLAMAAACSMLLAAVVLGGPRRSRLVGILETRPLVAVGIVSYSLFLWHEPLVRWLEHHGFTMAGRVGFGLNVAILLASSLVLSTLTYRLVEAPALRRKSRLTSGVDDEATATVQTAAAP